jgi:hypothetical protein
LRTGVWHGDRVLDLPFPVEWQVTVLWPPTPAPISDEVIASCLAAPAGQPPLAELCRGKARPTIIVDDTQRPTPVARLLPHVLRQFREAGIAPGAVRILVAAGTHGAPGARALMQKLGPAANQCHIIVHDPGRHVADLGSIPSGIRVFANRELVTSDFLLTVGGIYPNHAAGFANGPALTLGVLGWKTLRELHAADPFALPAGGADNPKFMRIIHEINARIGIQTMLSVQVDAERNIVRLACGDPAVYHDAEMEFARTAYRAPLPDDADVVISNGYPSDVSIASIEQYALEPLRYARSSASRIVLGSCPEGMGVPDPLPAPRGPFARWRQWWNRWGRTGAEEGGARASPPRGPSRHENPIWLYRTATNGASVPARIGDILVTGSWQQIVEATRSEQAGKPFLNVYLYPCAPIQFLSDQPP